MCIGTAAHARLAFSLRLGFMHACSMHDYMYNTHSTLHTLCIYIVVCCIV